jgi:uncharacterized protein YecE (DUF72 family)
MLLGFLQFRQAAWKLASLASRTRTDETGMAKTSNIRVGIGGWTYDDWRDNFYPKGLAQTRELQYASRQLSAIEINGTYYSTQKPSSFAKWHDETPDDFMFSLKANRFATNRKVLAEAGESIDKFVNSGLSELGKKLGPIVWQFAPTKKFDPEDFEAFLKLLPAKLDSLMLRHVLDVRHESFMCEDYLALARKHKCATVFTDSLDYPSFANITADFVYARLMKTQSEEKLGYTAKSMEGWAKTVQAWAAGESPDGLPMVEEKKPPAKKARDVFAYFISGAKERAPHAAMDLLKRLGWEPPKA